MTKLNVRKKPKIGILGVGNPPPKLSANYESYPEMVMGWLSDLNADFIQYDVLEMEFPTGPELADLWVIPGSRVGAYEDHPWIAPLKAFVCASKEAGVPMLGICFGHQIMAQALGGEVRKSQKGWSLGLQEYKAVNWPEELGVPQDMNIQAYHQDQVEEMPPGAIRIAQSDFCEIAGLWYPGFGASVQGHPEFSQTYSVDLIEARRTLFGDDLTDAALASQTAKTDTRGELAKLAGYLLALGK